MVCCFDVLGGKYGDYIGGECLVVVVMVVGEIQVLWMVGKNYLVFVCEGMLLVGGMCVLVILGVFDYCNMMVGLYIDVGCVVVFCDILLVMFWDDVVVCLLLELEGLKVWYLGCGMGYGLLECVVMDEVFYDVEGCIIVQDYCY